jgi:hypothetical protein
MTEMEAGEREGAIHPSLDPELADQPEEEEDGTGTERAAPADATKQSTGQAREPFQYGDILKAAGLNLSDHEIAIRYYRERALPYLVRFPQRERPAASDLLPEGLETWDIGHPLEAVDWLESVMLSPRVVPGMSTVQRVWGTTEDTPPKKEPLDLDLYVDSSGSMPNPQHSVSYLTLAGAIVCLSALRAGSKVQVTLWSGKNQFMTTGGFVRDPHAILAVLTGFYGGGTAFPIHVLRETFARRPATASPAHIMVISDDGVTTMWDKDEQGNSGWDVSAQALARAGGGGTLLLNLYSQWENQLAGPANPYKRARDEQGWNIHSVRSWEDLVKFAHAFSQEHYTQQPQKSPVKGRSRS